MALPADDVHAAEDVPELANFQNKVIKSVRRAADELPQTLSRLSVHDLRTPDIALPLSRSVKALCSRNQTRCVVAWVGVWRLPRCSSG